MTNKENLYFKASQLPKSPPGFFEGDSLDISEFAKSFIGERCQKDEGLLLSYRSAGAGLELFCWVSDMFWAVTMMLSLIGGIFVIPAALLTRYLPDYSTPIGISWLSATILTFILTTIKLGIWTKDNFTISITGSRSWSILSLDRHVIEHYLVIYPLFQKPETIRQESIDISSRTLVGGCTQNTEFRYLIINLMESASLTDKFTNGGLTIYQGLRIGYDATLTPHEHKELEVLAEVFHKRTGLPYKIFKQVVFD